MGKMSNRSSDSDSGDIYYRHYKNINARRPPPSPEESSQLNISPMKDIFNTPSKGAKSLYATPFKDSVDSKNLIPSKLLLNKNIYTGQQGETAKV